MNRSIAREYFKQSMPVKILAVMRIIIACMLAVFCITYSKMTFDSASAARRSYDEMNAVISTYLVVYLLPLIIMIGLGVLWAVSLLIAGRKESAVLQIPAVVSLSFSILGVIVLIPFINLFFVAINSYVGVKSRGSAADDAIVNLTTVLVLLIILLISVTLTSIARTIFYRSVKYSLSQNEASASGAGFYITMKVINAILKLLTAIIVFISMIYSINNDEDPASFSSYYLNAPLEDFTVALYVMIIILFLLGAVSNIMEVIMVSGYKNYIRFGGRSMKEVINDDYIPQTSQPATGYQQTAYPVNHPTYTAQPVSRPVPPAYPYPQATAEPAQATYTAQPVTGSTPAAYPSYPQTTVDPAQVNTAPNPAYGATAPGNDRSDS